MEAPHNGTLESRKRASANVRRPQRSRLSKKRERRGEERRILGTAGEPGRRALRPCSRSGSGVRDPIRD
ncbi:hypothetical protein P7K49_027555 [Saguinus oedipus]|uniref:Uncharacterized protein n=1 Tax=Saguinus oedipus TaxID=9490 RepID=A0ABQ9UBY1_SAGOE|nr:hypothetical protein P7K49_027555 [Saguinus oedipus]